MIFQGLIFLFCHQLPFFFCLPVKQTIQLLEVGYANSDKKAENGVVCGIFPYIRAFVALI